MTQYLIKFVANLIQHILVAIAEHADNVRLIEMLKRKTY